MLDEKCDLSPEDVRWLSARRVPIVINARGVCMRPTIEPGQKVCVTAPVAKPKRGEVVLLNASQTLVLHRLSASAFGWVYHRGDAAFIGGFLPSTAVVGIAKHFADGERIPERPRGRRTRRVLRKLRRVLCALF